MNEFVGTQMRGWDAATFRTAGRRPDDAVHRDRADRSLTRAPDWERLRTRLDRLTLFVPALRMRPLYGALGTVGAEAGRRSGLRPRRARAPLSPARRRRLDGPARTTPVA